MKLRLKREEDESTIAETKRKNEKRGRQSTTDEKR